MVASSYSISASPAAASCTGNVHIRGQRGPRLAAHAVAASRPPRRGRCFCPASHHTPAELIGEETVPLQVHSFASSTPSRKKERGETIGAQYKVHSTAGCSERRGYFQLTSFWHMLPEQPFSCMFSPQHVLALRASVSSPGLSLTCCVTLDLGTSVSFLLRKRRML